MALLPPPSTITPPDITEQAIVWYLSKYAAKAFRQSSITDTTNLPPIVAVDQVKDYAKAEIKYLSQIVSQILNLHLAPEEEEDRIQDRVAFWTVRILAESAIIAAEKYNNKIPYASVSPDSRGGLRIEWVNSETGVRLIVPAETPKAYIYHEQGEHYNMEPVSPSSLAHWLRIIT
jgi:hypothetical protein